MYYKDDWAKAREHLNQFWAGEDIGRPLAAVFAPRAKGCYVFPELHNGPWTGSNEKSKTQEEIDKWWMDPEENYKRMLFWFENTYFGGECVPATYVNWGASAAAAFFGSNPTFKKTSVWYEKCIHDWDEWKWEFDEKTNVWWNRILEITKYLTERSDGRYFVGMPEFGNACDNLSLMRGMDDLAMDCYEEPEALEEAIRFMDDWWVKLHEQLYQLTVSTNDNGCVLPWMSLWAPGRIDQLANDFSNILSPQMFKDICLLDIETMGAWTEYGMYHLDGQKCIRNHLDTLLGIDCIKAIEFTPGAGSPPTLTEEYIPKYRKILESGKRLYLLAEPDEVKPLCELLPSKGLFLCTWANSREEADDMLKNMYDWSKK